MPLSLRLPPLFARSKTASSSASSDLESSATTAASSTILASSSLSDLKKSTSRLHKQRDRSKGSSHRARSVTEADNERKTSLTPPSTAFQNNFAVDSTLLGSVGEEKEDLDGNTGFSNVVNPTENRPALVIHDATPPTTDLDIPTARLHDIPPSPLAFDSALVEATHRPRSADGLSVADSIARRSSNASPRHVSRRPSLVDSANAIVAPPKQKMVRKIWVKRPGASATLVQIREDDLVDDVRDMILRKYANSLGKTFDAPDMTLRIVARSDIGVASRTDRILGPEEGICHTIDMAFPGGQTVEEALIIDVPTRRTPKPSPRAYQHQYHALDDYRPVESGTDYFPPMPAAGQAATVGNHAQYYHHQPSLSVQESQRSMSVLTTGQIAPLPSPGSRTRDRHGRPKIPRTHTSSPTIIQHNALPLTSIPSTMMLHRRPRGESSASDTHHAMNGFPTQPHNLPTPPAPELPPNLKPHASSPPTPQSQVASLSVKGSRPKKLRKPTPDKSYGRPPRRDRHGSHDGGPVSLGIPISNMLEGIVPPINVLIVEDNSINLRVLQGLMKRLKVRWDSAINGQIAVDKWRKGGYHLILMDIQMPVMNGLQATKEIRRLEKVNGIGVFSSSAPSSPDERRILRQANRDVETDTEGVASDDTETSQLKNASPADKLDITDGIFKSPIIIVALTASSLQSDRHEALAAGCNDFLTKPVELPWLERKVKEWGCMQALIDFDGWKRWRDINEKEDAGKSEQDALAKRKAEKAVMLEQKQTQEKKRTTKRVSIGEQAVVNGNGYVNGR